MIDTKYPVREAVGVLIALALAAGFAPALPASALEAPTTASPAQTVTWYANNRAARARRQLACLDDPGHLRNTPDCINAEAASVTVALRESRNRIGELDARKPAFWSEDPHARSNWLLLCHRNPKLSNCGVARKSLELEANGK